jgi:hypothetical protein
MTKAKRKALQYIADHEPVATFPFRLSWLRIFKAETLIEEAGREPGAFGFIKYRLTAEGRNALAVDP